MYTSLAVLAMSASAALSPLSNLIHLHPHVAQADNRVRVTLINNALSFRDVKVGDKTYTVEPKHLLTIKAPEGTVVYAASRSTFHKRGDQLLEVTGKVNQQTIELN